MFVKLILMKLIKLDAIDSTNEFLKGLSNKQVLDNFTVITAESQTKGKGQMGAIWSSEPGKNIIMSVLIKEFLNEIQCIYNLNIAVSVAVVQTLEKLNIPKLRIKWPNDIMSDNKKIGGILIENSIKSDGTIVSIVGLGLNINQTNFDYLPKASSLAVISDNFFNKEEILFSIVDAMQQNIKLWNQNSTSYWSYYSKILFKKGIPMPFQNNNSENFMGIIQGVSISGKLQVLLEDDSMSEYDIKEIQMLY
jgi:BirA family biotin operon repressor/biotin-[acetyl-CoA-carboxylase] ligase